MYAHVQCVCIHAWQLYLTVQDHAVAMGTGLREVIFDVLHLQK